MVVVERRYGEPVERLVERFQEKVRRAGIRGEIRRRLFYEKPSARRHRRRRNVEYRRERD